MMMEPPPDNLDPPSAGLHKNPADNYPLNKNGFWNQDQSAVVIVHPPAPGGGAANWKSKSRKKCPAEGADYPPRGFTRGPTFPGPRFVLTIDNDPRGWVWDEVGNRFEEHQIPLPVYKCSYCMEYFKGSGALSEHLKSHSQEGSRDLMDLVAEYAARSADNSLNSDSDDEEVDVPSSESPDSEADSEEAQTDDEDEEYKPGVPARTKARLRRGRRAPHGSGSRPRGSTVFPGKPKSRQAKTTVEGPPSRVKKSRNGQPRNGADPKPGRVPGGSSAGSSARTNMKGRSLTGSSRDPVTNLHPQASEKSANSQLQVIDMEDEEEHDSDIEFLSGPEATDKDNSNSGRDPGSSKTKSGLRRRTPLRTGNKSGTTVPRGNPAANPGIDENIEVVQSKGKRKSRCKLCDMILSDRTKAIRHIKSVHLKEKPHLCPICPEAFTRKESLQAHMHSHARIRGSQHQSKPHRCHICSKGFSQKIHLTRHLLIHSGTRPHKCNLCEKAFFRRYRLTDHLRNSHQIN